MAKKKKKTAAEEKPKVSPDLEGFDIQINSFGEIISTYEVDKINEFLNKNVDDKKLRNRNDVNKNDVNKEIIRGEEE